MFKCEHRSNKYTHNHTPTISLDDGQTVGARSVTRIHERERWSAEALAKVRAMPRDVGARQERERVKFRDGAIDRGPTADAAAPEAAREMGINKEDLEEHFRAAEGPFRFLRDAVVKIPFRFFLKDLYL